MKRLCIFLTAVFFLGACAPSPTVKEDVEVIRAATLERAKEEMPTEDGAPAEEGIADNTESVQSIPDSGPDSGNDRRITSDLSEEFVKMIYYHRDKNLIAPYIILSSADAAAANKEIEKIVWKLAQENEAPFMTYRTIVNDNVLSILIQADKDNGIEFISYNFDTDSGKRLSIDEVLENAGMDWKTAEDIFYGERKAYWRALAGHTAEQYQTQPEAEVADLREDYRNEELPIILDQDGQVNIVCVLTDETAEKYWQLYCLSRNRTVLLQRNSYGADFPIAIIESPTEDEIANLRIVKRVFTKNSSDKGKRVTFLVFPLWDDLEFLWNRKSERTSRQGQDMTVLAEVKNLFSGDGILIEAAWDEIEQKNYQITIVSSEGKGIASLPDYRDISKEEKGIIYLPIR